TPSQGARGRGEAGTGGSVMARRGRSSAVRGSVKCRTCGAGFISAAGLAPCKKPTPGREYVDTGRANHVFVDTPVDNNATRNRRGFLVDLRLIQEQLRILCPGIDQLGELAFTI